MKKKMVVAIALLALVFFPLTASAGVKLKIAEDTSVDFGFRLQTQFKSTDADSSDEDFNVRRARLRVKANVTKWMSMFIQTERGSADGGSGYDMRIIDAWTSFNFCKAAKLFVGEHMAPAGRQVLTSSGGLMTIDRPAINTYNLSWGIRGRSEFNTASYNALGITKDTSVRDEGATLFGAHSFNDTTHFKYYLGLYDGIDLTGEDSKRYVGRVQFNLFDPEPGYFNLSTYVGKKKTIALGAAYDAQDDIANDLVKGMVDYSWYSFDIFCDYPIGDGTLTAEAAYMDLDLDDATMLVNTSGSVKDARNNQGNGYYAQAGYLIKACKLQPWVGWETWESDGIADAGSFDNFRVGLTYFVKGHNANVKIGYEHFEPDASGEEEIKTFMIGFYITY